MSYRRLTIESVASMLGRSVPAVGKRSTCPIRKHKRTDKSFSMFLSREGAPLWKCHSCDSPDNVGDAVKFYGLLTGQDRKAAWLDLREQGYEVPGLKDGPREPASRPRPQAIPIQGADMVERAVVPLKPQRWQELKSLRLGAVEKFALMRGLDPTYLRELDVVDVAMDAVGFGYRDPKSGDGCRVKVRAIDRKAFWIEPRGDGATALSPLYLAHNLRGEVPYVVVTEGEVDALTLRCLGIDQAVSLPDGASSALKVDLSPLWYRTSVILSATDADPDGDKSHRDLFGRVMGFGRQIARVRWTRCDGTAFKDANAALVEGGFVRADFVRCLEQAATQLFGYEVNFASAS